MSVTRRVQSVLGDAGAPATSHIKCAEAQALENDLEAELRQLQRSSRREMGDFTVDIEVPAERDRVIDMFSKMNFSTSLKSFALLDNSPKMKDLKEEALKQGQDFCLSSMFGMTYIDGEGKTIVDTPGAGSGEPPRAGTSARLRRPRATTQHGGGE